MSRRGERRRRGQGRPTARWGTPAKLLIFPRKTLAARYVVPSASRSRRRGGAKLKFMRRRAFSRPCVSRDPQGVPRGRKARAMKDTAGRTSPRECQREGGRETAGDSARGSVGNLPKFANQIRSPVARSRALFRANYRS